VWGGVGELLRSKLKTCYKIAHVKLVSFHQIDRPVNMYSKEIENIVTFLYQRLQNESKKGSLLCNLKKPIERASFYTGIKTSTVKYWINSNKSKDEPDTTCEAKPKIFKKLDSFDIDLIVRKMRDMLEKKPSDFC
jgi:hypothetical protein